MSMLFRQVAAAALAVAVIDALHQSQGPPISSGHLQQVGLAFIVAFVILEFKAGWLILWRQLRPWVRRCVARVAPSAPG
jgi:hypothetical protein